MRKQSVVRCLRRLALFAAVSVSAAAFAAPAQSDAERMGSEMMNPSTKIPLAEKSQPGDFKVLIYGNSITQHAPAKGLGWTNSWGMAASAKEKDFAHLVVAGLEKRLGKKAEFRIRNIAPYEKDFTKDVTKSKEIAEDAAWAPDYVVIAIGENSPNVNDSNAAVFTKFLADIARPFAALKNKPKIVMRSPFWKNPKKAECTEKAAAEVGAAYVDAGPLGRDPANKAIGLFSHKGVANHPGDLGMKRLADLVLSGFDSLSEKKK